MDDSKPASRSLTLWLGGAALLACLALLAFQWTREGSPIPMKDFPEYWSAGKAFLDHRNPYDPVLLLELQKEAFGNPKLTEATMMWNPPWTLVLVGPLGLASPSAAHILWMLVQFTAVVASIILLLRVYELPFSKWVTGFAVGLSFCPVFLLIWYGQIGGFCLLGLAGFLYFHERGKPLTAGAFAALTALKPHLLFGFGLVLLLDALVSRRTRTAIVGGGLTLAAAALLVWLANPMVYGNYFDAIRQPSSEQHKSVRDWFQPNLSYYLRDAIDHEQFRLQFVLTGLASLVIIVLWLRSRKPVDWRVWMPPLVLVSAICAAYGAWLFDLVVLLVPVVQATGWLCRAGVSRRSAYWIAGLYVMLNLATGIAPVAAVSFFEEAGLGLQVFVYFPVAVLLLYLFAARVSKRDSP